jgi:hypothetical protein
VDGASQLRATKELFAPYPARYWIAGGWAVDLMVGRQRREHSDVDVLILADDLPVFARTFTGILVEDHQTGIQRPWALADEVEPGRHTFVVAAAPCVQVVLALTDGDDWVFHRGRRTRRALADITHMSPDGLPFLGPELVLLFKARDRLRARDPRDKDEQDFRDVAPLLTAEQRQWLIPRLTHPGADEHPWLPILQAPTSATT